MTKADLEILRLKARINALETLMRGVYSGMTLGSPTAAAALRSKFQALRQEQSQVALRDIPPEYSDLIAGEYQEALDGLLKFIEDGLR